MNLVQITAMILARNEADNIVDAIASLKFASQIVVVDTGSSDDTIQRAAGAGAEVHSIEFEGFGPSKNRALEFCRHEWIFCMDADERVSQELAIEIIETLNGNSPCDGYSINRLTYFLGKPIRHSGWFPDFVLRLFRKGKGKYSGRLVHENLILDGKAGRLGSILHHYSYRDLQSYIGKLNIYSKMNAAEMIKSGKRYRVGSIIYHPLAVFVKMYLLGAGFLDGYHGFLLACLSSFHVFVKYAKFREMSKREKER